MLRIRRSRKISPAQPPETPLRTRRSARLLVLAPTNEVLLFKFRHKVGALAGKEYWATPGGGLEHGETFEVAAVRELREETGIEMHPPESHVAQRRFVMQMPDGEHVLAKERYFVVRTANTDIQDSLWTAGEKQVISEYKWWSIDELKATTDTVWPEELVSWLLSTINCD